MIECIDSLFRPIQENRPATVAYSLHLIPLVPLYESMEITGFPGFDRSITDDAIASQEIRVRSYRNRRIGDFLKELHLTEGRNTGFPNAKTALRDNGSEPLRFDMDPGRSYLAVTIPIHRHFAPGKKTDKQLQYEQKLLSCMSDHTCELTELVKAMGYKGISEKLRTTMESLVRRKKIKQVPDGRKIRYTPRIRALPLSTKANADFRAYRPRTNRSMKGWSSQ